MINHNAGDAETLKLMAAAVNSVMDPAVEALTAEVAREAVAITYRSPYVLVAAGAESLSGIYDSSGHEGSMQTVNNLVPNLARGAERILEEAANGEEGEMARLRVIRAQNQAYVIERLAKLNVAERALTR